MKDPRHYLKWMMKAAAELTLNEFKVFVVWFDDAEGFSAAASILRERLPFIERRNITRALSGIEKKGFFVKKGHRPNSYGRASPIYVLNSAKINGSSHIDNGSLLSNKWVNGESEMGRQRDDNGSAATHVLIKNQEKQIKKQVKENLDSSFSSLEGQDRSPLVQDQTGEPPEDGFVVTLVDGGIDHELTELRRRLIVTGKLDLTAQKLIFIAKHDRSPSTDPRYPPNNETAIKRINEILKGIAMTEGQRAWFERVWAYNAKKLKPETETREPAEIIPNGRWIDRAKLTGPPAVTFIDESIDIFALCDEETE